MKRALVCGAGGFVGSHLVKRLKADGCWIRGVDLKEPEFSPTQADEFLILDLRAPEVCRTALSMPEPGFSAFDEVYQLAADMGGMGFIHSAESEIMRNSALINYRIVSFPGRPGRPDPGLQAGAHRRHHRRAALVGGGPAAGDPANARGSPRPNPAESRSDRAQVPAPRLQPHRQRLLPVRQRQPDLRLELS